MNRSLMSCLGHFPRDKILRGLWYRCHIAPGEVIPISATKNIWISIVLSFSFSLFLRFSYFSFWWLINKEILCFHQGWFLDLLKAKSLLTSCSSFSVLLPWLGKAEFSLVTLFLSLKGPEWFEWVACWACWTLNIKSDKYTRVNLAIKLRGFNWSMATGSLCFKNDLQLRLT